MALEFRGFIDADGRPLDAATRLPISIRFRSWNDPGEHPLEVPPGLREMPNAQRWWVG